MSGIFTDYLTGEKVLFSTERANRPQFYKNKSVSVTDGAKCPFCPENSDLLPEYIYSDKDVRIVPNKYPALGPDSGMHEVVIDTPNHSEKFVDFRPSSVLALFNALSRRIKQLYGYPHIKYVQVFKNDGVNSGASIAHSHWQIIALDFIPQKQETIHHKFNNYFIENRINYFDYIYSLKDLIAYENEMAFAYCPQASPYTHYVRIVLKGSHSRFLHLDGDGLLCVADALSTILKSMNNIFDDFSYNICFQLSPAGEYEHSRFFIEIIPRHGNLAGFEFSTGCFINPTPAESAVANIKRFIPK